MNEFIVKDIPIELIDDFPDHPFKVVRDDKMDELKESIISHGVLYPVLVREKSDGRYEMIAGHRRKMASELIGNDAIRSMICDYDDATAAIVMVESNIHQRENLLPSEKAFAYKIWYEAMKHQGKTTSRPVGEKSIDELAAKSDDSSRQIQRYIRLTYLVPELLEYVDKGNIKMRPAVEMSYLDEDAQRDIVEFIDENEVFPSHAQTIRMRKLFNDGELDTLAIYEIMDEDKPNQQEHISVPVDRIRNKLPKTPSKRIDFIVNAIDHYSKYLERKNNKEAR